MDLLTRSQLTRASELLADAAKHPTTRDETPSGAPGFLDLPRRDLERYSLTAAIAAKRHSIMRSASSIGDLTMLRPWAGIEAEAHRALVARLGEPEHAGRIYIPADILYRDLNVAVAGAGGYLVGSTTTGSFIDALRALAVIFRLGAIRLPGQRENIALPRMVSDPTLTWLTTETTAAAESTPTTQQVAGSPKHASAYIDVTRLINKQSNPAVDAVLFRLIARALAVGIDIAALNGSGASGQPLGILNTAGLNTVSGTSLGYTGLVSAQHAVADDNAVLDPNGLGYVTTPTIAQTLKGRQRFTNTDSPLWAGAIHAGSIEGVTALSTKGMPTATMLYGDWSSVLVPEWGTLAIDVNPFQDFTMGIIGIRGIWSIDVLVTHPESFTAITSIT